MFLFSNKPHWRVGDSELSAINFSATSTDEEENPEVNSSAVDMEGISNVIS